MWKCPQCETVNKEERCFICGEAKPSKPKVSGDGVLVGTSKLRSTMRNQSNNNGNYVPVSSGNGQHSQQRGEPARAESAGNMIVKPVQNGYVKKQGDIADATQNTVRMELPKRDHRVNPDATVIYERKGKAVSRTESVDKRSYGEVHYVTPVRPAKKKMGAGIKWLIAVSAVLLVCVAGALGFLEVQRFRANSALSAGDYDQAKAIYESIGFYSDSSTMAKECVYQKADSLLKEGNPTEAKKFFSEVEGLDDSVPKKLIECDYQIAMQHIEAKEYVQAFDALKCPLENEYLESETHMLDVVKNLYGTGVTQYRNDAFEDAEMSFVKYEEGTKLVGIAAEVDYGKYLKLIEAHLRGVKDISTLYSLLDFEDTKEILISDAYIGKFLMGRWNDSAGNKIEFVQKTDGGSNKVKFICNLPFEKYTNYEIRDGIQYHGTVDTDKWEKSLRYEVSGKNTIMVYCYANGKTYTMYRQ